MSKVLVNEENLTNIANAIREKNGETTTYKPSEMASAINDLDGGKYAPRYISFYRCDVSDITDELSVLDTSNVTTMKEMFMYSKVIDLDLSNFDTSKVTNMAGMFEQATSLSNLNISSFDTSNVENINDMFCYINVTSLDLSHFKVDQITELSNTFYQMPNLVTLNLEGWNLSKLNKFSSTFYKTSKLENLTFPLNVGAGFETSKSANFFNYTIDLSTNNSLTHDSLMNVINNLYDIATKGCNVQTLQIGSTNLAKLTEDEIAIATKKGWNVT